MNLIFTAKTKNQIINQLYTYPFRNDAIRLIDRNSHKYLCDDLVQELFIWLLETDEKKLLKFYYKFNPDGSNSLLRLCLKWMMFQCGKGKFAYKYWKYNSYESSPQDINLDLEYFIDDMESVNEEQRNIMKEDKFYQKKMNELKIILQNLPWEDSWYERIIFERVFLEGRSIRQFSRECGVAPSSLHFAIKKVKKHVKQNMNIDFNDDDDTLD